MKLFYKDKYASLNTSGKFAIFNACSFFNDGQGDFGLRNTQKLI